MLVRAKDKKEKRDAIVYTMISILTLLGLFVLGIVGKWVPGANGLALWVVGDGSLILVLAIICPLFFLADLIRSGEE